MIRNARLRAIFWQGLLAGGLILTFLWLLDNTLSNLAAQNIKSGFAFLKDTAGFDFQPTFIAYDSDSSYLRAFIAASLNTVVSAAICCVLTTMLGFLLGFARLSHNWLLSRLAMVYVETLRNIPLLLQVVFWYFAVLASLPGPRQSFAFYDIAFLNVRGVFLPGMAFPQGGAAVLIALVLAVVLWAVTARYAHKHRVATGESIAYRRYLFPALVILVAGAAIASDFQVVLEYPVLKRTNFSGGLTITPEFFALIIAVSLYHTALTAEVVRSGIQSVGTGQTEAALALGLKPRQIMRKIVLPQALWVITPQLTSNYLSITKDTSLAAAIAFPELVTVMTGAVLAQTGQAIEIIALIMAVYLTLSLSISLFMNWYGHKQARTEL